MDPELQSDNITEATEEDWEDFWENEDLYDDYATNDIDIDYTTQT
jgi:hypothetical protein